MMARTDRARENLLRLYRAVLLAGSSVVDQKNANDEEFRYLSYFHQGHSLISTGD